MENKIFIIEYWPEYEEIPEIVCATSSRADAEEMVLSLWQNHAYETYLKDVVAGFANEYLYLYRDANFWDDFIIDETTVI